MIGKNQAAPRNPRRRAKTPAGSSITNSWRLRTEHMAGRPGFLGGLRGDQCDRDVDSGFGSGFGSENIRLGEPPSSGQGGLDTPPGFDPVWGTLGAPTAGGSNDWLSRSAEEEPEGIAVEVEILGNGFQISGQIHTGQFDRLSDWINMQSGFIQVRDAWHVHLGHRNLPDREQRRGILWVRLDQIVLVAEPAAIQQSRAGAPVVDKQRRDVTVVTPGYSLRGNLHIHAHGSMKQYLASPDPHFLPLTELNVHWLSDPSLVTRYPFAMINRAQLVTVLDVSNSPASDSANTHEEDSSGDSQLQRMSGAA